MVMMINTVLFSLSSEQKNTSKHAHSSTRITFTCTHEEQSRSDAVQSRHIAEKDEITRGGFERNLNSICSCTRLSPGFRAFKNNSNSYEL
jgi:hypothetical protein